MVDSFHEVRVPWEFLPSPCRSFDAPPLMDAVSNNIDEKEHGLLHDMIVRST